MYQTTHGDFTAALPLVVKKANNEVDQIANADPDVALSHHW
jgi:hypothetical protein